MAKNSNIGNNNVNLIIIIIITVVAVVFVIVAAAGWLVNNGWHLKLPPPHTDLTGLSLLPVA